MVVVMVYAMICYNIALDFGELNNTVFVAAFSELWYMGLIAFAFELLIVGPLAKKLAFRIVNPAQQPPIMVTLAISAITVCLMCPIMSLMATLIIKQPSAANFFAVWVQTTAFNFPMALCWQIFFAGPLVRLIFRAIFVYPARRKNAAKAAEAVEEASLKAVDSFLIIILPLALLKKKLLLPLMKLLLQTASRTTDFLKSILKGSRRR